MTFTIGKQPCEKFRPSENSALWGIQTHECFCGHKQGKTCSKSVAFCSNCSSDHHEDGYEKCICEGKGFIN